MLIFFWVISKCPKKIRLQLIRIEFNVYLVNCTITFQAILAIVNESINEISSTICGGGGA